MRKLMLVLIVLIGCAGNVKKNEPMRDYELRNLGDYYHILTFEEDGYRYKVLHYTSSSGSPMILLDKRPIK